MSENSEIVANFPLSTSVVTSYISVCTCTLGKLRSLVAGKWLAHQELKQTDMAKAPKHFAEMVKEVRQQLELSQEELAHELGVSSSTINRWENSKTVPFKLARRQFEACWKRMKEQGELKHD